MTGQYPRDPDRHILHMPLKKDRSVIDDTYYHKKRGPLYRLYTVALRGLALVLLPIWAKWDCRYRIVGRENFKKVRGQGAVLILNHVHFLDVPIACGCAIRTRKVRYVTLGENMDIPVAGSLLRALGGIPLGGTVSGVKEFRRIVTHLLERRKLVLFCAESALWPYYQGIRPFHRGGFVCAVRAGVPVIPMVITFDQTDRKRPRLIMTIGEPIPSDGKSARSLCDETHRFFEDTARRFYGEQENFEDETDTV